MTVKTAPSINFGDQSELSSLPNPLSTLTNLGANADKPRAGSGMGGGLAALFNK